jgi:hypothetical protein
MGLTYIVLYALISEDEKFYKSPIKKIFDQKLLKKEFHILDDK